jgi:hypothetical protein
VAVMKNSSWMWTVGVKKSSVGWKRIVISLFYYKKDSVTIYLLIYANDIIVASSSSSAISDLLRTLQADFALNDLGPLHYFMGIKVQKTDQGLCLSQKKYTADLLQRARMI